MTRKRFFRWLLRIVGAVVILTLAAIAIVIGLLRASLPDLDGEVRVAGLQSPVTIERDDLGVPTIIASNRLDLVYGLGFVHGQDRFFQMDLSRRFAAGELAALLGPAALQHDQAQRLSRMRHTAAQALAALPADQRAQADAYAEGVNAGLSSLRARPPEYWTLQTQPAPWQVEDTLLAVLAMALNLTPGPLNRQDTLLRGAIGPMAFDFFYPAGTHWDAALDGSVIPPTPIPGPEVIDFRKGWKTGEEAMPAEWKQWVQTGEYPGHDALTDGRGRDVSPGFVPGSNAWAVDGSLSSSGAGLVASDMHLGYSMPGTFYRTRLMWTEAGRGHDVIGLTLPGTPAVVTGSNGHVAWAPTAAHLDLVDAIVLETDPNQPERYRVPEGWAEFERVTERIEVHGGEPVEMTFRWTVWGPIIERTGRGTPVAFDGRPVVDRYVFNSPEALDLRLCDLILATDTEGALRIAAESGSPVINLLSGDRDGRVGWTIAGRLPRRMGLVGSEILSWADPANGWNGWLGPEEHPRIASPQVSRVFSGNQRKLGSEAYRALCPANSVLGARAGQIRDALSGLTNATPADMLAIQLDNRALLVEPWRKLLLSTLRHPKASAVLTNDLAGIIRHVAERDGRATPDSVGYRLERGFHWTVIEYAFEPLNVLDAGLLGERRDRYVAGSERPVWALLNARPPHLLNPRFADYDDLLLTAIGDVVRQLRSIHDGDLGRATWGHYANRPIRHPFSQAVPALSRWLDADTTGCAGGNDMPRVHDGGGGAVERLVVSPGHEKEGLFHMPGGQSGHFLSPYYRAGHEAWVKGEPMPLLPGPARHTLRLEPKG